MSEEKNEESGAITIKKDSLWKGAAFVFAALLVVSLFTGGFGLGKNGAPTTGAAVAPTPTANPTAPTPSAVKVSIDDDAMTGKKDAKVTIVEFSDYQCPFCGRFWTDTLPQIQKNYIDTGKARLVFRDFPLNSIHPFAQKAAEAVECARKQGGDVVYFKMHDKLFANQGALDVPSLKKYAQELGLDATKFATCLDSGETALEVQKDSTEGQSYGVQGTPAFFVNGKLISGAQPFTAFQQAIDAALAA
ncbi:MAG: DsbA family protein [Nanoarchaeota archaeon]|mgnify:CR=1 FL=1